TATTTKAGSIPATSLIPIVSSAPARKTLSGRPTHPTSSPTPLEQSRSETSKVLRSASKTPGQVTSASGGGATAGGATPPMRAKPARTLQPGFMATSLPLFIAGAGLGQPQVLRGPGFFSMAMVV